MADPPPHDPDTQELVTHIDINGNATYEVVAKPQEQQEDDEDFTLLKTFMGTPKANVTQLQALLALKALIRSLHRIQKAD